MSEVYTATKYETGSLGYQAYQYEIKYRCFTVPFVAAAWVGSVLCCQSLTNWLVALDGFVEAGDIEKALKMAD